MDFYHHSNTHDLDQDRFEDLYRRDFIHAISCVACCKLAQHHLDPYQRAAFRHGIVHHNTGEEEANPMLELAMEYAGALSTIVFDKSCRLCDLTEAQVGRNQFAMDVAVDRLVSGPLYPNALSVLFCTFPRPASPTSSAYPIGCPSPT